MRKTYTPETFRFTNTLLASWERGAPERIIVHRQGNPGAHAAAALNWGDREGAFSIHDYIEDGTAIHAVDWTRHAYHTNAASAAGAEAFGYSVLTPWGTRRGDIGAVGIETCDVKGGAAGQAYSLSRETRITLVILCAEICARFGLDPMAGHTIDEHAAYGDSTRAEDLGDALNIPDLRADVADLMAGREPWRTVQEFATGNPAPDSWRPGAPAPVPATPATSEGATVGEAAVQPVIVHFGATAPQVERMIAGYRGATADANAWFSRQLGRDVVFLEPVAVDATKYGKTVADFRADCWGQALTTAALAGLPVWGDGRLVSILVDKIPFTQAGLGGASPDARTGVVVKDGDALEVFARHVTGEPHEGYSQNVAMLVHELLHGMHANDHENPDGPNIEHEWWEGIESADVTPENRAKLLAGIWLRTPGTVLPLPPPVVDVAAEAARAAELAAIDRTRAQMAAVLAELDAIRAMAAGR